MLMLEFCKKLNKLVQIEQLTTSYYPKRLRKYLLLIRAIAEAALHPAIKKLEGYRKQMRILVITIRIIIEVIVIG